MIGQKPGDLLQGEKTSSTVKKAIRDAINQEVHGDFELLNYHKNGNPYWIEAAITPLYSETGQLEGFMAVERDITDRVKLENELKQKAIQAEAANTAKSRFLATMSHELRTPMNGILGMGELLEETNLNQEQAECVSIQMQSGRHMLSVLNDILDFSKIESSEIQINNVMFPLKSITQGIKSLYEPLCREKGIRFLFDSNVNTNSVMLMSDNKRLMQVLQNLVGNALKFTSKGYISLATVITGSNTEGQLTLKIADTGVGIDESKIDKIFKPFVQAEDDTTRKFGGTGLGLAITSEIIKAMNGSIEVTSEVGKGSEFIVTLPINHFEMAEPNQKLHDDTKTFDGSGYRALIVEDNSVNAILLKRHLVNRHFSCFLATEGESGLKLALEQNFDCIFMDNHMPIKDGIEVTRLIRRASIPKQPLIVGYTADAFDETRRTMLDSGCNEVLTKPCDTKALDKILTKHLSAHHRDSEMQKG
ncbi:sensor histidine kinase [Vibrio ishigakensis]|uniref:histidine kinase n=1 Tax=Vibrio ishigakensis TaxID=1481914 RepID=A0A0B8NMN1_9VIBR|nr:sensor histidine kinase [Vibrio ishigakensis]